MKNIYELVVFILCIGVVFGPISFANPMPFEEPTGCDCFVLEQETHGATSCVCSDPGTQPSSWSSFADWLLLHGSCPGQQKGSTWGHIIRDAVENESGYTSITLSWQNVGAKYECIPEADTIGIGICVAAAAACGIICPATWVGCLCIPAMIEVCQYCNQNNCVADTDWPLIVYEHRASAFGDSCTGQGGGES